jgi:hypothetical protein
MFEINQEIHCTYYGGRKVWGIVTKVSRNWLVVKLLIDYQGKNDLWEKGQLKELIIKSMKNVKILPEPPKE